MERQCAFREVNNVRKLTISAPWYEFQKKVKALFERDPQIIVGDIYEPEGREVDYAFDIEVLNHEKFIALDRVIPGIKEFGNVTLGIVLYDEENINAVNAGVDLYKTIFSGNPIVKDVRDAVDHTGTHHGFVRFVPEVIQFFNDDISDFNGNWSGLAQDIAREVFTNDSSGIHFCTAGVNEGMENSQE